MTINYSVIIPHYNSENSLEHLLKSIPNENHIEIIVVDDRSSTDLFKDVIKKSHLDNISGYINDGVKGAGAARNIGLKKAKGEFLIFADADDFFTRDAFIHIESAVNSVEADIIYFNVTSQSVSGNVGFRHLKISSLISNCINQLGSSYNEKVRLTHNVPWGKVFRAEFIKANGITFDELIVSNDVMFSVKAGKLAQKISCSKDIIYCVTQNDGTLTTKKNINNFWIRLDVYANYYHYLSAEEREAVEASPLPLLLQSIKYGPSTLFKAMLFLRKNKVYLVKNLNFNFTKLKRVLNVFLIKRLGR